jgi:hypothetical protein
LSTPIIDFFGVDGIGKTRILHEIAEMCLQYNLICIQLDGNQSIAKFVQQMFQQARKYRKELRLPATPRKGTTQTQIVATVRTLLQSKPVVILFDAVDTSNREVVHWIEETLPDLLEDNNLFVVLASKQKIVFENNWSMARKLTPFQLNPLNRGDSQSYVTAVDASLSSETRETIFQWTRGYPLAMDVMLAAINQQQLHLGNVHDQQQLLSILMKRVIDKKVLARVEPGRLVWYKEHFSLLSIPRRFNLTILKEVLEKFGSPLVSATRTKVEYMGLPRLLNSQTDVLYWDMQKAGFTIDPSIRNIFFWQKRILFPSEFAEMHRALALLNEQLAEAVPGEDKIRYLREYLYHSAYSSDDTSLLTLLEVTLKHINEISPDAILQFSEEFRQDSELQEILGNYRQYVYSYIDEHSAHEEE